MVILDLTKDGFLGSNISNKLNNLALRERKNFTNIIGKISIPLKNNIDWWVSNPASRNTLNSDLFLSYCKIRLVKEILESGKNIDKIIVETPEMKFILSRLQNIKGTLIVLDKSIILTRIINTISFTLTIGKQFLYRLFQITLFRILYFGRNIIPAQPITLIDTFALPGYYSKDRYYNGLWESLNSAEKKSLYFIPIIVMTKLNEFSKAYKELFSAERQFIFREAYIKITDIVYALLHFIRVRFIKIKSIMIEGIDYSPLIISELHRKGGYSLAIEGLINYKFIKRLKQRGIELIKVIDWWEGQALDKGLQLALKKYYPNTPTIGYLGYAPRELELQLYPADYELNNNVVPEKIAVIGKGYIESLKILNPLQNIECAPAFRYNHLWDQNLQEPQLDKYTVLIALPIVFEASIHILKLFNSCLNEIKTNKLRVLVKPHPAIPIQRLKDYFGADWPHNYEDYNVITKKALREADILISGMSSICMEAMALGIPVIVIKQLNGLEFIPIPGNIPNILWKLCGNKNSIIKSIDYFKNREESEIQSHRILGQEILETYFEPVSRKAVIKFLK